MKTKIILLAAALMLAGTGGMAQAQCTCGQIFFNEGPAYECSCSREQTHFVYKPVGCVDHETFYTEGMRISTCEKGQATVVPIDTSTASFYSEGYSKQKLDNYFHMQEAEKLMPAAGK